MIPSVLILTCLSLVLCVHTRSLPNYYESQVNNDNYYPTVLEEVNSLMSVFKQEFQDFKERHTKVYQSEEEENLRLLNFVSSLLQVNRHNELYQKGLKTYEMSINQMSDWTTDELSKLTALKISNTTGSQYISPNGKIDIPQSFDWREKGAVTEVKNQLYCGSCFAFSATGSLEGQIWRKTGKLISLSEQQIVDCDQVDDNCNGGFVQDALNYIKSNGGIENEKDYPYVSGRTQLPNSKCYFDKTKVSATDTGFVQLPPRDEEKLKEALVTVGPISIAISATESFKRYSGGIFHEVECDQQQINHAVLLVGYGTDEVTGTPYWIIKNSWGTLWGENGYFRFPRNIDACKMTSISVYPLI